MQLKNEATAENAPQLSPAPRRRSSLRRMLRSGLSSMFSFRSDAKSDSARPLRNEPSCAGLKQPAGRERMPNRQRSASAGPRLNIVEELVCRASLRIEAVTSDPVLCEAFAAYCARQLNCENLRFFLAVEAFRLAENASVSEAICIYDQFLADNASDWVCVEPRHVAAIQASIVAKASPAELRAVLGCAQSEARHTIETDVLPRFVADALKDNAAFEPTRPNPIEMAVQRRVIDLITADVYLGSDGQLASGKALRYGALGAPESPSAGSLVDCETFSQGSARWRRRSHNGSASSTRSPPSKNEPAVERPKTMRMKKSSSCIVPLN